MGMKVIDRKGQASQERLAHATTAHGTAQAMRRHQLAVHGVRSLVDRDGCLEPPAQPGSREPTSLTPTP